MPRQMSRFVVLYSGQPIGFGFFPRGWCKQPPPRFIGFEWDEQHSFAVGERDVIEPITKKELPLPYHLEPWGDALPTETVILRG